MIDYGYANSLPELTPTSPPGAAYKVTHDWGSTLFDPAGGQYSLYILHNGMLKLKHSVTFGDNSELIILGTVSIARTTTLGSGSRVVFGENGMMTMRAKSILMAKQCSLQAPIKQIFGKDIDVKGIWEIPTAYPQWFTSAIPGRQSKDGPNSYTPSKTDWSKPIQKAIDMKITGEVLLLRGVYEVEHPIDMKPGIQFRGECGVNWDNLVDKNGDQEDWTTCKGSTVIWVNVDGGYQSPYQDFIIRINANVSNGIPSVKNTSLFQSGTIVENIFFKAKTWAHARCIVAGCPCHLNNLGFRNFRQAVKYIPTKYYDGRRITNCNAADNFTKKVATTADDDYMFDLYANGDACVIEGLGVGSKVYKALKVGNSCGTIISGCIFNAPVHLRGCKATVFTANHMESSVNFNSNADTRLIISNSDVTVQGNFFEKSNKPSIVIQNSVHGEASVVSLSDNQFLYIIGIENDLENPSRTARDEKDPDYGKSKEQIADAALSRLVKRINGICEYDVQVDPRTVLNLSNNFRYAATSNQGISSSYPFGIMISKSDSNNDGSTNTIIGASLEEFNNKSFCLSQLSSLTFGKIVSTPVFLNENGDYLTSVMPNSAKPNPDDPESKPRLFWLVNDGGKVTYEYEYCIFPNGNPPSTETYKKVSVAATPSTSYGGAGLMIGVRFENSGGRARVKLRRSHTVSGVKVTKTVIIPVCGAGFLYDNGIAIAGYKWKNPDEKG